VLRAQQRSLHSDGSFQASIDGLRTVMRTSAPASSNEHGSAAFHSNLMARSLFGEDFTAGLRSQWSI